MPDNTDGTIIGLVPTASDPIVAASSEPAHITMLWFGSAADLSEDDVRVLHEKGASWAAKAEGPITASVTERGTLGADEADVVMLDGEGLRAFRDGMAEDEALAEMMGRVDQYDTWTPHVTLGYPETPANEDYDGETVEFDRLVVWVGTQQTEYALGGGEESPVDDDEKEVEAVEASGQQWYGVLAPIGVMSGDGRIFDVMLDYRELPIPLKYMPTDQMGHDGSVVVANITDIWEDNGLIMGKGVFTDTDFAKEAIKLRQENMVRGVSVDLDAVEMEFRDSAGKALTGDDLWPEDGEVIMAVTKGRIAAATICAIPAFAEAYFNLGTMEAPETEKVDTTKEESMTASAAPAFTLVEPVEAIVAAGNALKASWFKDPELTGPTAMTITEDGMVYGHAATWNECHVGIQDKCVTAPHSLTNYAYFHVGAVVTDEGEVPVGHITMGTGHAALNLDGNSAAAHYDNTGAVVADIHMGEDRYGIWFSGALRPGVTEDQVRALRAAAISGDWRPIGAGLEMVAALAVNVPGFPVPRTAISASGTKPTALIAAAIVEQGEAIAELSEMDMEEFARAVVREMRASDSRRERAAALRASLGQENRNRKEAILARLGED